MKLKQLAKELNLSISSVSKALRDSHEISSSTKNAVIAKAKELNFQVNPFASSLRKQKSKTIAVIIPEVVNGFFGWVINGVESIAQEKGYHVLIYLTHEDMQREVSIVKLLQNGRVDGIMISMSEHNTDTAHLEELKEMPLVLFDRVAEHIHVPKVTSDDFNCGFTSTQHLIQSGCKRIAFLSISQKLSISKLRLEGYLQALKEHKIEKDSRLIIYCTGNDEQNNDEIRKLLKRRKGMPDGIFASVEKLAISTYEICRELKLNIPKDIKIVTLTNSYLAGLLNPSLTAMVQPAYEMGREAATILFKLVEQKHHHFLLENTILSSKLIVRDSTKGPGSCT